MSSLLRLFAIIAACFGITATALVSPSSTAQATDITCTPNHIKNLYEGNQVPPFGNPYTQSFMVIAETGSFYIQELEGLTGTDQCKTYTSYTERVDGCDMFFHYRESDSSLITICSAWYFSLGVRTYTRLQLIPMGPTISNMKVYIGSSSIGISVAKGSRFNLRPATSYTVTYTDSNDGPRIFSFLTTDSNRLNSFVSEPRGLDQDTMPNGQLIITSASNLAAVISGAPETTNGDTPFTVTFTFAREIQDFTLSHIHASLTNAVASDLQTISEGRQFTAVITPTSEDDITIGLEAGSVVDHFGTPNNAADSVTVKYIDETYVGERTSRIISNFMTRRGDAIVSNQPNIAERMSVRTNSSGNPTTPFSATGSPQDRQLAVSSSLRQIVGANQASKNAQVNKLSELARLNLQSGGMQSLGLNAAPSDDGLLSSFDIWVKARWARYDSATSDGNIGLLFIGADYKLNDDIVVGVMAQFDWTDEADDIADYTIEGRGWMVGPYMAAQLHQNLIFDASFSWGKSDNDVSPFDTYTDSFDGQRWLATAKLTGSFKFNSLHIAPHIGVQYFQERQKAYIDSLSIDIPDQTVRLGRLSFGPRLSTEIKRQDGTLISPYLGIKGLWDFDRTAIVDLTTGLAAESTDEFRARVDAGLNVRLSDGMALNGEGFYDGIGAEDYKSYGGSIRLNIPLQRDSSVSDAMKLGIDTGKGTGFRQNSEGPTSTTGTAPIGSR